jgi:hypothetical protein
MRVMTTQRAHQPLGRYSRFRCHRQLRPAKPASVVGTLRRDRLDHLLVWDERQAERLLREYVRYYEGRPHRGLRLQPPAGEKWLPAAQPPPSLSVRGTPILGGLHHRYGTAVDGVLLTG